MLTCHVPTVIHLSLALFTSHLCPPQVGLYGAIQVYPPSPPFCLPPLLLIVVVILFSIYLHHLFKSLAFYFPSLNIGTQTLKKYSMQIIYAINEINSFQVAFRVLQVGVYADVSWLRLLLWLLFWPGGLLQAHNRRRSVTIMLRYFTNRTIF